MDEAPYDERLHRLQRLAYGAVASDAERAAALDELEAMRRERAAGEAQRWRADAAGAPIGPVPPGAPHGSTRPEVEASGTTVAKPLGWAIAGAAALLVWAGLGWQVGAHLAADDPSPAAVSTAPGPDAFAVPIGDTAVLRPYESEPTAADVLEDAYPRDSIAPTDYRRLLARSDGVSLYIARLHGGTDVCAVVTLPGEFTTSRCTHDGMFPRAGLQVEVFEGDVGLIRGAIRPNGVAELTPAGYVPGPLPAVDG